MKKTARRLIVCFLSMVLVACGAESTPQRLQGAVVVLLDTVRADHLSCYGYARQTTPHIDRLAEQGALFEQVVSFSPWTQPSVAAILAGTTLGAAYRDRLERSVVVSIRDAGYHTAAFTEGVFVSKTFGFDLGFEVWEEREGALRMVQEDGSANPDTAGGGIAVTFAAARQWLTEHRNEPFFLLIHTYEAHTPYTRHALVGDLEPGRVGNKLRVAEVTAQINGEISYDSDEVEYIEALYDSGIHEADRYVGELLAALEELGLRDRTLVVVTSDHGEELGDHYPAFTANHGHSLRDDLLLVPLIVHDPTQRFRVSRVPAQVRTMDVLPTVADLLAVPPGDPGVGKSLVAYLRGEEKSDRTAFGGSTRMGPPRLFLRSGGYKFIRMLSSEAAGPSLRPMPDALQLYDLDADPGEQHNVASARPEVVKNLGKQLPLVLSSLEGARTTLPGAELDPELRARLKALGYD